MVLKATSIRRRWGKEEEEEEEETYSLFNLTYYYFKLLNESFRITCLVPHPFFSLLLALIFLKED